MAVRVLGFVPPTAEGNLSKKMKIFFLTPFGPRRPTPFLLAKQRLE